MTRLPLATLAIGVLVASLAYAHGATIDIGHNRVEPAEVTIAVGGVVHFQNHDEMPGGHTIVADDGSFSSPGMAKDEGWHHTFEKPGTYSFHIKEHPGAKGKVIVVEKKSE